MKLRFLGGTGTVTGSRYLLSDDKHRVLVDCGMYQVHIPAHHEHPFRTNVNTNSGLT